MGLTCFQFRMFELMENTVSLNDGPFGDVRDRHAEIRPDQTRSVKVPEPDVFPSAPKARLSTQSREESGEGLEGRLPADPS